MNYEEAAFLAQQRRWIDGEDWCFACDRPAHETEWRRDFCHCEEAEDDE